MLRCVECGRSKAPDVPAEAWRAYATFEPDGTEDVAVFCPDCAQREFGDDDLTQVPIPTANRAD